MSSLDSAVAMEEGMNQSMRIHGRAIEPCTPPVIIGEIAQAHDGSLGIAHAYIDALADSGADAVKFQTHIADQDRTIGEEWSSNQTNGLILNPMSKKEA